MHEELINIYDEAMNKIGYEQKKSVHVTGSWHKSIHCWLFRQDETGRYVIFQRRSSAKLLMPDYYDVSVAGHYEKDEEIRDGLREVDEEFGISVPDESWKYLGIKFDINKNEKTVNKEFCEVFFAEISAPISSFVIRPVEVGAVLQIRVEDGHKLFSGESGAIEAEGYEWDAEAGCTQRRMYRLTREEFIPRIDPYYAKMFVIADLYFQGYPYLYI
jgi:isopentenyldiphosphate isomerase